VTTASDFQESDLASLMLDSTVAVRWHVETLGTEVDGCGCWRIMAMLDEWVPFPEKRQMMPSVKA